MILILLIIGAAVITALAIAVIAAFVIRVAREDIAEWYRKDHEGHARAQRPDKWQ